MPSDTPNSIPAVLRTVGTEVDLADILALEAVRVLLPDVYFRLHGLRHDLTNVEPFVAGLSDPHAGQRKQEAQARTSQLLDAAGDRRDAVDQLLRLVFPATAAITSNTRYGPDSVKKWRASRRVASADVFSIYFERRMGEEVLPAPLIDTIASSLGSQSIQALIGLVPAELIESMLGRIEDFEQDFPEDPTEAVGAIQNLVDRVPQRGRRHMFDTSAELAVARVVLRLLRRVEDERARSEIGGRVWPRLSSLTAKWSFLFTVGHREDIGHGLVSQELESRLEAELRDEMRAATTADLAAERELLRLLDFLNEHDEVEARSFTEQVLRDDQVLVGALTSGLSEMWTETLGAGVAEVQPALPAWDWLLRFMPEPQLGSRVKALHLPDESVANGRARLAVETAKRYADGWRPRSLMDRQVDKRPAVNVDVDRAGEQDEADQSEDDGDREL